MRDFKKLQVWSKAHRLALDVYQVTTTFPSAEIYGLTSQMRRAATSIPTNIAEGCGRNTDADFARFLHIAAGSASELEYQFILVRDLNLLDTTNYEELSDQVVEIKRMLTALIKKLKAGG